MSTWIECATSPGEHIEAAARDLQRIANTVGVAASCVFNGRSLTAIPTGTVKGVIAQYHKDSGVPAEIPEPQPEPDPVPLILTCPYCYAQHVDAEEWATKPHRTHRCAYCKHEWRPADVPTVGVLKLTDGTNGVHPMGIGSMAAQFVSDVMMPSCTVCGVITKPSCDNCDAEKMRTGILTMQDALKYIHNDQRFAARPDYWGRNLAVQFHGEVLMLIGPTPMTPVKIHTDHVTCEWELVRVEDFLREHYPSQPVEVRP